MNPIPYFNIRLSGPLMFLLVGIITYAFSAFTYTYIERPFLYSAVPRPGKSAIYDIQGQVVESAGLRN